MGGNTMLMNRAAAELVAAAAHSEVVAHDWLTYQLVSGAEGFIHYDPHPFVRYKQHADNVVQSGLESPAAAVVISLAGATAGFLLWNYPRGVIFAGDGGAYLWGVVIAVVCVLLVQRDAQVSPWFPVLLLIYPVWEALPRWLRR